MVASLEELRRQAIERKLYERNKRINLFKKQQELTFSKDLEYSHANNDTILKIKLREKDRKIENLLKIIASGKHVKCQDEKNIFTFMRKTLRQVYDFFKNHPDDEFTMVELQDEFNMKRPTVHYNLETLLDNKLILKRDWKTGERGRPRMLYRLV